MYYVDKLLDDTKEILIIDPDIILEYEGGACCIVPFIHEKVDVEKLREMYKDEYETSYI